MANFVSDKLRNQFGKVILDPSRINMLDTLFMSIKRKRNANRQYTPIFILGAAGSGSTLMSLSLAQRFDCAGVVAESVLQIPKSSFLSVLPARCYSSIKNYENAILPDPTWDIDKGRKDLLNLYRSYSIGESEFVVDKGPNANQVRVDFLAKCFPNAIFIMIFRDPVVNIEGMMRKWSLFKNDSLEENIRFYDSIHTRFLDQAENFSEQVYVIDYQNFVKEHEKTLELIGKKIGMQPSKGNLSFSTRKNKPGQGIRNVENGRIQVVQGADEAAYKRLSPEVVEKIRSSLGELHKRLRNAALKV